VVPEAASPVFLLKGGEAKMIDVTKVNGKKFTLNSRLIETIEETPDTVITLTTGKKIIVKESRQEVKNLVKLYENDLFTNT
jgi:flagellar protein FlbD